MTGARCELCGVRLRGDLHPNGEYDKRHCDGRALLTRLCRAGFAPLPTYPLAHAARALGFVVEWHPVCGDSTMHVLAVRAEEVASWRADADEQEKLDEAGRAYLAAIGNARFAVAAGVPWWVAWGDHAPARTAAPGWWSVPDAAPAPRTAAPIAPLPAPYAELIRTLGSVDWRPASAAAGELVGTSGAGAALGAALGFAVGALTGRASAPSALPEPTSTRYRSRRTRR